MTREQRSQMGMPLGEGILEDRGGEGGLFRMVGSAFVNVLFSET